MTGNKGVSMNILFFLTPKSEVDYVYDDDTLGQTLEKMEYNKYTAIPIISHVDGTYVGTITEGDLLWDIKERFDLNFRNVGVVPVIDDSECFIGIITRKDVMLYLTRKCAVQEAVFA